MCVSNMFVQLSDGSDSELKGKVFYFDIVHPDGNTGHRVMGELGAQLVLDAWAQVRWEKWGGGRASACFGWGCWLALGAPAHLQ